MQRLIMKDAVDIVLTQMTDKRRTLFQRRQKQVIHVRRMLAMRRRRWSLDTPMLGPAFQLLVVTIPDISPLRLNPLARLNLRVQKRRENVRRQITRAYV